MKASLLALSRTALAALSLVGWAGSSGTALAAADDPAAIRHEIEAAHVQQVRADTSGDRKLWKQTFQDLAAPDFTFSMPDGDQVSRVEYQENELLRYVPLLKGAQEEYHVEKVTEIAGKATEEGYLTYRISIVDMEGRVGPKGKTHVVTGRNTYRAVWIKVGTSWKAADVHVLKHEEQTDGKPSGEAPVDPSKASDPPKANGTQQP